MFSPLSAFSAFGKGTAEGFEDPKLMNQLGIAALGRALQMPMDQGPQPPPPGQASVPMHMAGPPPPQAPQGPPPQQGPQPMPPEMQGAPMAQQPVALQGGMPPGAGGPPSQGMPQQGPPQQGMPQQGGPPPQGMPQGPPQMAQTPQGMMPQFDLQTLIHRVQQANPGLPPAAMMHALTNAVPLLNVQGKHDLAMLGLQQKYDNMALRQDLTTQVQNAISNRWGARDASSEWRNTNTNQTRENVVNTQQENANARFVTREGRLDDQFNRTYDRLVSNAQQRWDMNEKKLQQAMQLSNTREGRMAATQQLRTLEQEALNNHRAVMEKIQAGFLPNAKDKNALIAEANAKRDAFMAKIEQYRTQLREGGAPQQQQSPAAPAGPPQQTAPARPTADGPDGSVLEWDGKAWVPQAPR